MYSTDQEIALQIRSSVAADLNVTFFRQEAAADATTFSAFDSCKFLLG